MFLEVNTRAAEEQERLKDYVGQLNNLVHKTNIHAKQAVDQRVFCNMKINEAILHTSNAKLHSGCTMRILLDYI